MVIALIKGDKCTRKIKAAKKNEEKKEQTSPMKLTKYDINRKKS